MNHPELVEIFGRSLDQGEGDRHMKRLAIRRLTRVLFPVAVLSALWTASGAPLFQGL